MDYSCFDAYVDSLKAEAEKIADVAEEAYGERPKITVEPTALVEVRLNYEWPSGDTGLRRRTVPPQRVTSASITGRHKPTLLARKLGRIINWSKTNYRGTPDDQPGLRTKEQYLRSKRTGRDHAYNGWTAEQLEEPPNALEKLLHPSISRRVIREQQALEDYRAPAEYVYQPRVYTNTTFTVNYGAARANTGTILLTQPQVQAQARFDAREEDLPDE